MTPDGPAPEGIVSGCWLGRAFVDMATAAGLGARMLASMPIEKRGTRFTGSNVGMPDLLDDIERITRCLNAMDLVIISCRER